MPSQRSKPARLLDRSISTMARLGSECWPKSGSSLLLRFFLTYNRSGSGENRIQKPERYRDGGPDERGMFGSHPSVHEAAARSCSCRGRNGDRLPESVSRSEEDTSEIPSPCNL